MWEQIEPFFRALYPSIKNWNSNWGSYWNFKSMTTVKELVRNSEYGPKLVSVQNRIKFA